MPKNPNAGGVTAYCYTFGNAEFDAAAFVLRVRGALAPLENKPLAVLHELLTHAGEVVTKRELLDTVWEGRPTVENVLPNAVAKLRKALGPDDAAALLTVPRVGYRLDAVVQRREIEGPIYSTLALRAGGAVPGRKAWVLLERLDRGSGDEVWLAGSPNGGERTVFKFALGGDALLRLKREATVSRLLSVGLKKGEAEGIVPVLDWNFKQPPFCIECAFGGANLADWAVEHLVELGVADRIGLFLQVARAVAAAHSLGVLHKDLNPLNVLIQRDATGAWRARLTGFGSSRLVGSALFEVLKSNRMGLSELQLCGDSGAGSPLYLAPELIAGATATAQSDVYALGVLLYQLLAGDLQLPMATGWQAGIDDELLEQDIAEATAGDPAQRLQSVATLIDRLINLESRRAKLAVARVREQRLARAQEQIALQQARRPWVVALVAALFLGLGISLLLYREAEGARQDALHQARLVAETNRFINEDILGGAGGSLPIDRNPRLRELLDTARQRLVGQFDKAPLIAAELWATLARAYHALGDFERSDDLWRQVHRLQKKQLSPASPARRQAQYGHAKTLTRLSKFDEARALLEAADSAGRDSEEHHLELRLEALLTWGTFHFQQFQWEEALHMYRQAKAVAAELPVGNVRKDFDIRRNIAAVLRRLGEAAEAERIARALLGDPAHTEASVGPTAIAVTQLLLGRALRDQGAVEQSLGPFQFAIGLLERTLGADDQLTITALSSLGYSYSLLGDVARYARIQNDVYARAVRRWGEGNQYTLVERMNVGFAELDNGRPETAAVHFEAAAAGLERVSGIEAPVAQAARYGQARAALALGHHTEVLEICAILDPDVLNAALAGGVAAGKIAALRGQALLALGSRQEGEHELRRAIAALREGGEPKDLATLKALLVDASQ